MAGQGPDSRATGMGMEGSCVSTAIITDHAFVDTVPAVNNQTARVMLRTTAGGSQVTIKPTNRFSSVVLPVGAAHVAIRSAGGTIVSGSDGR